MQLLVYITNQSERMPQLLSELMENGVHGATVVNCEGMLHMLATAGNIPVPALFGRVRSLFNENDEHGKMMLAVMPDEMIAGAKNTIERVCGDFDLPNTGIMFSVPVMHFEGVTKPKADNTGDGKNDG